MVAILDRRFAAERIADRAEPQELVVLFAGFEIEHGAIVPTRQLQVEPTKQFLPGLHFRHAFVLNRSENGAANQNLPTRIALSVALIRARDQAALLRTNAREPFIKRLNA